MMRISKIINKVIYIILVFVTAYLLFVVALIWVPKYVPYLLLFGKRPVERYLALTETCTGTKGLYTEKAIKYCAKALELDPDNPKITYKMAEIYSDLNEHEKAIAYFSKTLKLSHNFNKYIFGQIARQYFWLAHGYLHNNDPSTNEMFDKSIEYFNKFIDLELKERRLQSLNEVVDKLGDAYIRRGRHAEAIDFYNKLLEQRSKITNEHLWWEKDIYFGIARNYLHLGNKEKALEQVDRLREIDEINKDKKYYLPDAPRLLKEINNFQSPQK